MDIGQLTGSGFHIPDNFTVPFEVASVDFQLTEILFDNPGGGNTADAQVKMQGAVSFAKVPLAGDLGVTANVEGTNFVVADSTGISLTGLDVHVPLPTRATLAGMKLAGQIDIGYNHAANSFSFGGGVTLTSQPQGASAIAALDNAGVELDLSVSAGHVTKLGFGISKKFSIFSLSVSTVAGQPFAFDYDLADQQFEISGGLQLEFSENTILANFGSAGSPGIVIKDGVLQTLNATISGQIELAKASISSNGLTFLYNGSKEQFEMYGDLSIQVPTGGTTQMLTAQMGTASAPGLSIAGGELVELNMALSGGFDIFGLKVSVTDAGVQWQKADNTLLVGGSYRVDFEVFQTTVTFPTDPAKALKIAGGKFEVQAVTFELDNAVLGPVTLTELKVSYTADGNGFDLGVTVNVGLPGGWAAAGEFDFVASKLDTISVDLTIPAGELEIADTGLSVIDIHVKVTNLDDPPNILVTGGIAVVWGEQIAMLGQQVYLFRAEGDLTVDADEFILDC